MPNVVAGLFLSNNKAGSFQKPGICPKCGGSFFFTSIERVFFAQNSIRPPAVCRICLRESLSKDLTQPAILKAGNF